MLQMQDLPQAILAALASATGPISSLDLASKLSCDVQKVVGAVKSLEVLEGYIETEMVAAKRSQWISYAPKKYSELAMSCDNISKPCMILISPQVDSEPGR